VYEISKALVRNGVDVTVISDRPRQGVEILNDNGFKSWYIDRLHSVFSWSKKLLAVLKKEDFDAIILLLGLTSVLRPIIKIDKPIFGILTCPVYDRKDILDLGAKEILRNSRILTIHVLGALIPRFLIRSGFNSYRKLFVLSMANKKQLVKIGIAPSKIIKVPHAIEPKDLVLPNQKEIMEFKKKNNPKAIPMILYFGSPITLRGTDLVIEAFAEISKNHPSKLVILSRIENSTLISTDNFLRKLAKRKGVTDSVEIITGNLEKNELLKYVSTASIVCLPFKFVISDVPIVIIESMILGKLVISTYVDGIPELLLDRGLLVEPNDVKGLTKCMLTGLTDPTISNMLGTRARQYMIGNYPDWDAVGGILIKVITSSVAKIMQN
jgi:phosphatidyl-myo-inositol dimannoside synthase